MKCSICGVEAGGPANSDVALTIETSYSRNDFLAAPLRCQPDGSLVADPDWKRRRDEAMENFVAIFGFYDQRARAAFEICGACLAERLKGSWRERPPLL